MSDRAKARAIRAAFAAGRPLETLTLYAGGDVEKGRSLSNFDCYLAALFAYTTAWGTRDEHEGAKAALAAMHAREDPTAGMRPREFFFFFFFAPREYFRGIAILNLMTWGWRNPRSPVRIGAHTFSHLLTDPGRTMEGTRQLTAASKEFVVEAAGRLGTSCTNRCVDSAPLPSLHAGLSV